MSDTVKKELYKNHVIEIKLDEDPENPRDWDNLCEFHCAHRRQRLGDKSYTNGDEMKEVITELIAGGKHFIFNLYAYEHGGICVSLNPFSCPWDSGQLGFVVIDKLKLEKEFGNVDEAKAKEIANNEVVVYNMYLEGEVYRYDIDDGFDSCCGFYGMQECLDEAKATVDAMEKTRLTFECPACKGTEILIETQTNASYVVSSVICNQVFLTNNGEPDKKRSEFVCKSCGQPLRDADGYRIYNDSVLVEYLKKGAIDAKAGRNKV